jgi:hypothetical protein
MCDKSVLGEFGSGSEPAASFCEHARRTYCSSPDDSLHEHEEPCHLGGVTVSKSAIRPKVRGFKPGRGDGFLRAIKIRSFPCFGGRIKPEAPNRYILRHVKNHLQV